MKINLIGHASIFVETADCKILMDPVLWDPFCEGLNESCPQREVITDKLPQFDFLIISHRHLDHFDLRSLAYLSKDVDVLIPQDKLIEDSLRQLGYSRIYRLKDFETVRMGSTSMMTTRSEMRVPEYGMIFADESGVFWNAVDTLFSPQTIQYVRKQYPQIDFLLTPWQLGMEIVYQYNQSLSFPVESYSYILHLISLTQPKAIAAGAQGFKYINEAAWHNQIVFPLTRERFEHDLAQALPELQQNIFTLNPGDVLSLKQGKCHHSAGACEYAKMIVDDRDCLDFSPVQIGNPLRDPNPENYDLNTLRQTLESEISFHLPQFIEEKLDSLFNEHRRWQVIYQLEIIFPDGCQKWQIDFRQEKIQVKPGRNPLANLFTYITASSFYNLVQKKRDWDYLFCSGEYRTFDKIYDVTKLGTVCPDKYTSIQDPLALKFTADYVANNNIKQELATLQPSSNITDSVQDENPMLKLGNLLIKRRDKKALNSKLQVSSGGH
jgi:UDP-MurNAc hydroxylase